MMKRRIGLAMVLAALSAVGVVADDVGAIPAAAPPLYTFPTIELARKISTYGFGTTANSSIKHPGDAEGTAYDPFRNSMWIADDSKHAIYEVDFTTGSWMNTISQSELAASLQFVNGGPNGPATADVTRAADLEGMAYDAATDTMYVIAGPCCQGKQHIPAIFRLVRNPLSGSFMADSFQSFPNPQQDDFSGAAATGGQLWFGYGNQLISYDYVNNVVGVPSGPMAADGKVNGVGFSQDGSQLWVTTSNETLQRFTWPGGLLEPAHTIKLKTLGLIDSRAVEVVGDQLVLADGYDHYPPNAPDEFGLRIFNVGQSMPTASFTMTPPIGGGAPFSATFQDTTTNRPTSLTWDFGDSTPPVVVPVASDSSVVFPSLPIAHTFQAAGPYTITLMASNPNGATTSSIAIVVTSAPSASFTATPPTGVAPLSVAFADTSTSATGFLSRVWNFGDSSPLVSNSTTPSHVYTAPGVYTVTLQVANGQGTSTATNVVSVNGPPNASFVTDKVAGAAPLEVSFTDTSAGFPQPNKWEWDFGDGSPTSIDPDPGHLYKFPGVYSASLTVSNGVGSTTTAKTITVSGGFKGIAPIRLMDTRRGGSTIDGLYRAEGSLGGGLSRSVRVTGRGGLPDTGVGSVILNVTAVGPTAASYLTVWPQGKPQPNASNLNFVAGKTVPNMVVVPAGAGGNVSIFNEMGTTDVIVDLLGWFPAGPVFTGLTPARLMDTRDSPTIDGRFQKIGPVGPNSSKVLQVLGRGGVPSDASIVGSIVLNVTATDTTAPSYLTVWPTGFTQPNASNLNWSTGETVPNMVILPVPGDGRISLYNSAGTADLIVDVLGWFPKGPAFTGLTPARLMDTRANVQTIDGDFRGAGALNPGQTRVLKVAGRPRSGVPGDVVGSIALNVTVTNPTDRSYLTVFPTGSSRPNASNLNFVGGQTVANMVVVPLGPNGEVSIFNESGTADVIVDVLGWFAPPV